MDILVMHITYPTNEEFSRDNVFFFLEKYNSETLNLLSTLVKEICQQPMHYMLTVIVWTIPWPNFSIWFLNLEDVVGEYT